MPNDLLEYEHRENLYRFLLDDWGFVVTSDNFFPDHYNGFHVTLTGPYFQLSYINDRFYIDVEIADRNNPSSGLSLFCVREYLYKFGRKNFSETNELTNRERVDLLNDFIKQQYFTIAHLFSPNFYDSTLASINDYFSKI